MKQRKSYTVAQVTAIVRVIAGLERIISREFSNASRDYYTKEQRDAFYANALSVSRVLGATMARLGISTWKEL